MQFADIILPLNIPKPLTYGIPIKWQGEVTPGTRVEVSMGKNKIYSGIVLRIHDRKPDSYTVKPVRNLIDKQPVVTERQLRFWQWVAQYYLCNIGEVMNAALPAHLKLMSESLLVWAETPDVLPLDLSDEAYLIAEALQIRKQLTIGEVRQLLEGKNTAKAINELLERSIATVSELLEERYKERKEKYVLLTPGMKEEAALDRAFRDLEKAPKQLALLMAFFQLKPQNQPVAAKDLLKKAKAAQAQLSALVEKGILYVQNIAVDRLVFFPGAKKTAILDLSNEQQKALEAIKDGWQQQNVALLHGVTGSGKTLVYVQLIREALERGQQVLFLLPEIALTAHIVSRLRAFFGEELGVYHSRFSNNERVEIWNKVKEKQYKIILGARSALWLPFQELGCIIIDEEHDSSYKQHDPAPRFHARDAAIYLASLHHARVLLGSATPSLESVFNAQKGKYAYVPLHKRYLGVALPEISLVSAKNVQAGLSPMLTINLLNAIQETLHKGKQVILFQNKRGYSPFLICGACGWVAHCKYCDVSLTYHKATDKLHCHYCGNKTASLRHCPQCGQSSITARSFGTEKIEEELHRIFPKMKIARMDWDSMRGKNKHAQLIDDFTQGRVDILVGTQMVVKGLDFENVGLVGILSADSLLAYPDFRVNERGFQLMEQVSGRAGRMDGQGKVLIQAYNLKHPVLQWVKAHDFRTFYQKEMAERQQFGYPPFFRIIRLICRHREEQKTIQGAVLLADALGKIRNIQLQGPAAALIPRVRNHYLQEIWLKLPPDAKSIHQIKGQIAAAINHTLGQRGFSSLQVIADVDPA